MTTAIAKKRRDHSLVDFGSVVDDIFQNSLRHFFDDNAWSPAVDRNSGIVPVNIRETAQRYEIDIVAPGCRKDDFTISVEDHLLTISFTREEENREPHETSTWIRHEYHQRSFTRSFTLDETVDGNNIHASYTDGILRLILPRNEKSKQFSRTVTVK